MEDQAAHERKRAVRALLMRPMLSAHGDFAEEFVLIRIHADWIRDWFGKQLGWSLYIDTEIARLGKVPAEPIDATRPACDPGQGVPFSRTRYVLFCLALASLERGERQTTLGNLAKELGGSIDEDPLFSRSGIIFDLTLREGRRDLVHVIRLLLDLGVILRVHGDESQYLIEKGDVLYTINRPAISAILNVRRGPSSIRETGLEGRISGILEEPLPDTEAGWNRHMRMQIARKLIDEPVLYYADLEPDFKAYLDSQRASFLSHAEQGTGLIGEIRAEGIALVDEAGALTDVAMPEEGTEGHFTLLLASFLAQKLREAPGVPIGSAELVETGREFIIEFGQYWRKDARVGGAEKMLLADALSRLESLRLVESVADGAFQPLPAIARYWVDEAQLSLPKEHKVKS